MNNPASTNLAQFLRDVLGDAESTMISISGPLAHALADAVEIADSCARADIECNVEHVDVDGGWYDVTTCEDQDADIIAQATRYLTARGLIHRHADLAYLVRFPKTE